MASIKRFDLTPEGFDELHRWLLEYVVAPRQLTMSLVRQWGEDALASLSAGHGARVQIDARDSITGRDVTRTLSDRAWVAHVQEEPG